MTWYILRICSFFYFVGRRASVKIRVVCVISGYHSGEYEDESLLGYSAM
jgi:hypothetical protein